MARIALIHCVSASDDSVRRHGRWCSVERPASVHACKRRIETASPIRVISHDGGACCSRHCVPDGHAGRAGMQARMPGKRLGCKSLQLPNRQFHHWRWKRLGCNSLLLLPNRQSQHWKWPTSTQKCFQEAYCENYRTPVLRT